MTKNLQSVTGKLTLVYLEMLALYAMFIFLHLVISIKFLFYINFDIYLKYYTIVAGYLPNFPSSPLLESVHCRLVSCKYSKLRLTSTRLQLGTSLIGTSTFPPQKHANKSIEQRVSHMRTFRHSWWQLNN